MNYRVLLLGLLVSSFLWAKNVHAASPELIQVVGFSWTGSHFEFATYGSGVAVTNDLVLVNTHTVKKDDQTIDWALVCPSSEAQRHTTQCFIPAVVADTHPAYNASLLKLIRPDDFLPATGLSVQQVGKGDKVKIEMYPPKSDIFQSFEDTTTFAAIQHWLNSGGILTIPTNTHTVVRGHITNIAKLKQTGERYFMTDIPFPLQKNGGFAYAPGDIFVGIPTMTDNKNQILILDHRPLRDWIHNTQKKDISVPQEYLVRYNKNVTEPITLQRNKQKKQEWFDTALNSVVNTDTAPRPTSPPGKKDISKFIMTDYSGKMDKIIDQNIKSIWYTEDVKQMNDWNLLPDTSAETLKKNITRSDLILYLSTLFPLAESIDLQRPPYQDVPFSHPQAGLISMYKNFTQDKSSKFFPDRPITRAEATHETLRFSGIPIFPVPQEPPFDDIPLTHPRIQYLTSAKKYGIISGYAHKKFSPDDPIRLTDFASILVKTKNVQEKFPAFLKSL